VEIYSAIYKKVRTKELSDSQAHDFIEVVKNDLNNISIIIIDKLIINNPQKLLSKYGKIGLRTLDAIQLASIISVKSIIDAAFTNDLLLKEIFIKEGINCLI
jgi:predicted nucleic acid-binding protein